MRTWEAGHSNDTLSCQTFVLPLNEKNTAESNELLICMRVSVRSVTFLDKTFSVTRITMEFGVFIFYSETQNWKILSFLAFFYVFPPQNYRLNLLQKLDNIWNEIRENSRYVFVCKWSWIWFERLNLKKLKFSLFETIGLRNHTQRFFHRNSEFCFPFYDIYNFYSIDAD